LILNEMTIVPPKDDLEHLFRISKAATVSAVGFPERSRLERRSSFSLSRHEGTHQQSIKLFAFSPYRSAGGTHEPSCPFRNSGKGSKAYGRFLYAGVRLANADVGSRDGKLCCGNNNRT